MLTCDHHSAVFTIANKSGRLAGAHDNPRVGDQVDGCGVVVVMHVEIALVGLLNLEHLPVNRAGLFMQELPRDVFILILTSPGVEKSPGFLIESR